MPRSEYLMIEFEAAARQYAIACVEWADNYEKDMGVEGRVADEKRRLLMDIAKIAMDKARDAVLERSRSNAS